MPVGASQRCLSRNLRLSVFERRMTGDEKHYSRATPTDYRSSDRRERLTQDAR